MEAPKCKLCGQRHYGLCSKGGDAPDRQSTAASTTQPEKPPAVSTKPAAGGKPKTNVRLMSLEEAREIYPDSKPKYDRNAAHRAYMKNWMRKYRAKDKEAGK